MSPKQIIFKLETKVEAAIDLYSTTKTKNNTNILRERTNAEKVSRIRRNNSRAT